jgi:glycosyltransferase involved in cell wall biosynthesis
MPKVGLMLRHVADPGGISVFTINALRRWVQERPEIEFHALYSDEEQKKDFADLDVTHTVLRSRNKFAWDQIWVPRYARAHSLDLILNAKLSVPLFSGAKKVFCLPGMEQFEVAHVFPLVDRIYTRIMMRRFCRRADAIITHTEIGKRDIVRHMGISAEKIKVVPHGVHAWLKPADQSEINRIREAYSLDCRYILFVGGLNPVKNLANLIRAFEIVAREDSDVKLALAGFKRWGHGPILEFIESSPCNARVERLGFVPDSSLRALYSGATCYVLPSWYEGFGIPILEAMACGAPVVTTERGCSPEVEGDAALFVDPADPANIADAIMSFLDNPELAEEFRRKGIIHASGYTWDRTARGIAHVIDQTLAAG